MLTTHGITKVTRIPGDFAARSVRKLAVNEFNAAFAALYADR